MECRKGCCRSAWPHGPEHIALDAPPTLRGYREPRISRRLPTPQAMADAYASMLHAVKGLPPPRLEFFDTLHGSGGLFFFDSWVIGIGLTDAGVIADALLRDHPDEVRRIALELAAGRRLARVDLRKIILGGVMGRVIAHELGHALLARGYRNPYAPDAEAGADFYAAKFDAARGKNGRLGQLVFHTVGCTGRLCTHPSPDTRAAVYAHGYNEQLAA